MEFQAVLGIQAPLRDIILLEFISIQIMYSPPGRDIDALLPQHAESIAALKASLGPSLNRTPDDTIEYDDIWLLRFILSSKGDMNKVRNTGIYSGRVVMEGPTR